ALQTLEEGGGLSVAERRLPQEEARQQALAAAHLEEVEEHQRERQGEQAEGQGREEVHESSSPRSCARRKSSIGASVLTRRYPISRPWQNVSTRSRNACRRSRYPRSAARSVVVSRPAA